MSKTYSTFIAEISTKTLSRYYSRASDDKRNREYHRDQSIQSYQVLKGKDRKIAAKLDREKQKKINNREKGLTRALKILQKS